MANAKCRRKQNKCQECGILHNGWWRYPSTNRYLCYRCYRANISILKKVIRALIVAQNKAKRELKGYEFGGKKHNGWSEEALKLAKSKGYDLGQDRHNYTDTQDRKSYNTK